MTTLSTTYPSSHFPYTAEYARRGYINNGWESMKRWDGYATALVDAGIAGPSRVTDSWQPSPTTAAGDCTVGLHLVRYRYLETATGQVSNPSEEREVTVAAGAEELTFPISTSGAANIIRSTDTKADRIVLEMSTVGADDFYKVGEADMDAASIVADIADAELETKELAWSDYGHDTPPLAKFVLSHQDRLWVYGQVVHQVGNADFTNGSADVGEGTTDPDWNGDTLGTPSTDSSGTWLIRKDGDAVAYEIDHYDSGANKIVLKENYAGTTESDASYTIFNRIDAIWVSTPSFPESFEPLKFLGGPNGEGASEITAGVGWAQSVLFFSERSMFRLVWDQGPLVDPTWQPLSSLHGALTQRVVIEVEGVVYAMDRSGWTAWRGLFPELISRPVDTLRDLIDYDQAENFHAVWFPDQRAIRWHVCYSGDTYPKNYVQLDVDTGTWSTGTFLQGISDSALILDSDQRKLVVLYGDENGHTWLADRGTCDGCDADYSHLTASTSATTTVIPTAETLPTANEGIAGCYAYWLEGDESRLISGNTALGFTVATAFSSAPSSGDTFWIGPYTSKLKTKAWAGRLRGNKIKMHKCWVDFVPLSETRYLLLRIYENLSATPRSWDDPPTYDHDGTIYPGRDTNYDATDWLLDMAESDGNIEVPVGKKWSRFKEIELEIFEPDSEIELAGIEMDGHVLRDEE